jgi:hypothetical protein
MPRYIVWKPASADRFDIWTEKQLIEANLSAPSERDPARVYAGDNYAEATAATIQANAGRRPEQIRVNQSPIARSIARKCRSAALATGSLF